MKTARGDEEIEDEHGGSPDMSTLKHALLTTAIVACGYTIAFFVDDLQMGTWYQHVHRPIADVSHADSLVLSFVGSTGSTTISFILPGLFYWKVCHTRAGYQLCLTNSCTAYTQ